MINDKVISINDIYFNWHCDNFTCEIVLDEDGCPEILYDGISIAYIDRKTGCIHMYPLFDVHIKHFEENGILLREVNGEKYVGDPRGRWNDK